MLPSLVFCHRRALTESSLTGPRRYRLLDLSVKDYTLYRVICMELDQLQLEIESGASDLPAMASAMEDRRLLIEWLRDLRLPPASLYTDSGPTEAMEEILLREGL